jgi:hypothetical protein
LSGTSAEIRPDHQRFVCEIARFEKEPPMLASAKRIIPIRAVEEDRYSQACLLTDGSVGADPARLDALMRSHAC